MREKHPYGTFIPRNCESMIIGSFPIGKFSDPNRRHEILPHEILFFFGGERNLLWRLIGDTFGVELKTRSQIQKFLREKKIGVGDVIRSCVRREGRASDKDLLEIEWNTELLSDIRRHKIRKLYFTSVGVERWFFRLFPDAGDIEAITLISPSAQSARALGSRPDFKAWRRKNPGKDAYEYILRSYRKVFLADED